MNTFFENNFKARLIQKNAMMLMNACWFRILKLGMLQTNPLKRKLALELGNG
jgi:hypothetical protein